VETIVFFKCEKDTCDNGGVLLRVTACVLLIHDRPNGTYLRDCRLSLALRAKGRVPAVDKDQGLMIETM